MNDSVLHTNVLESMEDGVIAFDTKGKIITFNNAASKILGIECEDALNKLNSELFFNIPENDDFNDILITVIREQKTKFYKEVSFCRNDGTLISLGVTSSLLKDKFGLITGSLLVIADLTARQKAYFLEKTLSRYISKNVVNLILENPDDIILDGEEKSVSILFSDIRNFTTLSENMAPKDIVYMLRKYFEVMVNVVFEYEGTLDKFIGDAIMCLYGAPIYKNNHAEMAVTSALVMLRRLRVLNEELSEEGFPVLKIGIGVNSGNAIAGNIGSKERLEYTAIGDSVNIASRLEGLNKEYGTSLIISKDTYDQVKHYVVAREIDVVVLKGKEIPVRIYEVLNTINDSTELENKIIEIYNNGLKLYKEKKYNAAREKFENVLKIMPNDLPSVLYIKRCLEKGMI